MKKRLTVVKSADSFKSVEVNEDKEGMCELFIHQCYRLIL